MLLNVKDGKQVAKAVATVEIAIANLSSDRYDETGAAPARAEDQQVALDRLRETQAAYVSIVEAVIVIRQSAIRARGLAVRRAMATGLSYRVIGDVLNVKRQRVHQISTDQSQGASERE